LGSRLCWRASSEKARASALRASGSTRAASLALSNTITFARQHSREPKTKPLGGDLGYFTREPASALAPEGALRPTPAEPQQAPIPDSVRSATFALELGATSEPVAYDEQFAIVRMSGERPERHVSLDSAAPAIRTKLWRERRQRALDALVSELRKREQPKVFTDRIYAIDFEDMDHRPGGFAPDPVPAPVKAAK